MKNLLKDNRLVINFILAVICIVVFIASLLLHYGDFKETVMVSGPLGDTFGGLFSPIIGLVTVLLVYHTFQYQRTSNALLEWHQQNLLIEIPENLFNPAQKATPNRLDIFIYGQGRFDFLTQLRDKLTYLTQLAESVDTFILINEHKSIFLNEVSIVLHQYFKIYHPKWYLIVDYIHNCFQDLPDNDENYLNEYIKTETRFELNRTSFNSRVNSYLNFCCHIMI